METRTAPSKSFNYTIRKKLSQIFNPGASEPSPLNTRHATLRSLQNDESVVLIKETKHPPNAFMHWIDKMNKWKQSKGEDISEDMTDEDQEITCRPPPGRESSFQVVSHHPSIHDAPTVLLERNEPSDSLDDLPKGRRYGIYIPAEYPEGDINHPNRLFTTMVSHEDIAYHVVPEETVRETPEPEEEAEEEKLIHILADNYDH